MAKVHLSSYLTLTHKKKQNNKKGIALVLIYKQVKIMLKFTLNEGKVINGVRYDNN